MGISCEKAKNAVKETHCICKKCGRVFKYPIPISLCERCRTEALKDRSSADILLGDFKF